MLLPYAIVKRDKLLGALAFCEEKWQLQERDGVPKFDETLVGLS
jgi:hypothetical protein